MAARLLEFSRSMAWAKYDDHKKDAKVVSRVNGKLKRSESCSRNIQGKLERIVLEGGAIDVNGARLAAHHRENVC